MACFELITKFTVMGRDIFEFDRINSTTTELSREFFAKLLTDRGIHIPVNNTMYEYDPSLWAILPGQLVFQCQHDDISHVLRMI